MGTPTPLLFFLSVVAPFVLVPLIAVIIIQARKYTCYRHELEFKREMVERGLSVDEIERLVSAKSPIDRQK